MPTRSRARLILLAARLVLLVLALSGVWAWMQYVAYVQSLQIAPIPVPTPP